MKRLMHLWMCMQKRLAENMNARFRIDARVPSILIAGSSNFSVRQKEKQNTARDKNMAEWKEIEGILHKIKSTGMGGISADRPDAIQQLDGKLKRCEELPEKRCGMSMPITGNIKR